MDNAIYQTYLLEFIAWRAAAGNLDFHQWQAQFRAQCEGQQEKKDASEIGSTAEILRDVRAQPTARTGEVPGHEQGKDARVGVNLGERLAAAKKRLFEK